MIVLCALGAFVFLAVVGVAKEVSKYFCYREELDFKREMIGRGMPADEVERLARSKVLVTNQAAE